VDTAQTDPADDGSSLLPSEGNGASAEDNATGDATGDATSGVEHNEDDLVVVPKDDDVEEGDETPQPVDEKDEKGEQDEEQAGQGEETTTTATDT